MCRVAQRDQIRTLLGTVQRHVSRRHPEPPEHARVTGVQPRVLGDAFWQGPLAPEPEGDTLTKLLRQHERRQQGRAALRKLASQHSCRERCAAPLDTH